MMSLPSPDDPHTEDGFTGRQKQIRCWACDRPMTSREYRFGKALLWSTVHSTKECEDLAYRISRGLAREPKKAVYQPAADME